MADETVKVLEGRELEIVKEAVENVSFAQQQAVQAKNMATQMNQQLNALLELAVGESPIGLSFDVATGALTREKTDISKESKKG